MFVFTAGLILWWKRRGGNIRTYGFVASEGSHRMTSVESISARVCQGRIHPSRTCGSCPCFYNQPTSHTWLLPLFVHSTPSRSPRPSPAPFASINPSPPCYTTRPRGLAVLLLPLLLLYVVGYWVLSVKGGFSILAELLPACLGQPFLQAIPTPGWSRKSVQ